MSLVAYGASDESDTSDIDEEQNAPSADVNDQEENEADSGKISDEDDYVPTSSSAAAAEFNVESSLISSSVQQAVPTSLHG